jgi:hypothetical protein
VWAVGLVLMPSEFFLYGATGTGSLSFIRVICYEKNNFLNGLLLPKS